MPSRAAAAIELAEVFQAAPGTRERVGIEVECGLVRPESGQSINYLGGRGLRALLEAVLAESQGEPVIEDGNLLAVRLPEGAEVSLEPGGVIEYSGAPQDSVAEVVAIAQAALEKLAAISREVDMAMVGGGVLPFTNMKEIPWIPKSRVQVMRDYFRRLGDEGSLADGIMGLTMSSQVTLDYTSEEDLSAKLRMLVAVSPILAALFVNSPIEDGQVTGALSRRLQMWRKIAPGRCGVLPFAVGRDPRVTDIVDWALARPMIYRAVGGRHVAAPAAPFGKLLADGFDDTVPVTEADWLSHLNQLWPHVRIRRTLELRIADGMPWPYIGAVPALWAGLAYNRDSLAAALALTNHLTWDDLEEITDQVALRGLRAQVGSTRVQHLASELLEIARGGLAARVASGTEPATVMDLLDPLADLIESGQTFAERNLAAWLGGLGENPARYVAAYRI